MRYVPSLDGFRGLAVFLVFLYHGGWLPCGWMGVQLFFVLSGYLITRVLLETIELPVGRYFGRFYWRRILRIWPVYLIALAFLACYPWSWEVSEFEVFAWSFPFLLTFTYNFYVAVRQSWNHLYSHLWSLGVEEQFYLLWPFFVYRLSRRTLWRLCLMIILAGPAIRFVTAMLFDPLQTLTGPTFNERGVNYEQGLFLYMLPFAHLDAFASGALLCVLPSSLTAALKKNAVVLFSLLLAAFFFLGALQAGYYPGRGGFANGFYHIHMRHYYQYLWGYSVINTVSAAFILVLLSSERAAKLFCFSPLILLGKVSYGFYVYHPIVGYFLPIEYKRSGMAGAEMLLWFVASFAFSLLSYFALERPILRLKRFFRFTDAPAR